MPNQIYITRLEGIIQRIFHSLDTINPKSIEVKYIGEKYFDTENIDQYCFQFEKNNSHSLWFELLIPTNSPSPHNIDLVTFSNQIIYKYNLENIANYISTKVPLEQHCACHFEKKYIFEVSCISQAGEHNTVYINIDPENFFE